MSTCKQCGGTRTIWGGPCPQCNPQPTPTETPTPLTDEKWRSLPDGSESALHEMKDHARILENKLTVARRVIAAYAQHRSWCARLLKNPLECDCGYDAAMQQKEKP